MHVVPQLLVPAGITRGFNINNNPRGFSFLSRSTDSTRTYVILLDGVKIFMTPNYPSLYLPLASRSEIPTENNQTCPVSRAFFFQTQTSLISHFSKEPGAGLSTISAWRRLQTGECSGHDARFR